MHLPFRPLSCFRTKNQLLFFVHPLITLPFLNCAPVHVFPFPAYPGLQVQRYEPIALLHCAFMLQAGGKEVHSLISEKKNKIKAQKKANKSCEEMVDTLLTKWQFSDD